ncbi:NUDIX hydrolase [Streptomyces sp. NPDC093225]|uniref:NUDIX hydrolase n=1 Tax=Streptomyces sp. NPDC093225 TaxID=3366034 RepID=UPI0037F25B12
MRARVSAYGIAVERRADGDHLLLTRLSGASPVFGPGLWHLPGGGIDPGEQPDAALAREFHEETGRGLRDARLLEARTYAAHRLGVTWHLVALFYRAGLVPGPLRITETDGSTADLAWLPLADLDPSALTPPTRDAVAALRSGRW